jgi:hypothetical protein
VKEFWPDGNTWRPEIYQFWICPASEFMRRRQIGASGLRTIICVYINMTHTHRHTHNIHTHTGCCHEISHHTSTAGRHTCSIRNAPFVAVAGHRVWGVCCSAPSPPDAPYGKSPTDSNSNRMAYASSGCPLCLFVCIYVWMHLLFMYVFVFLYVCTNVFWCTHTHTYICTNTEMRTKTDRQTRLDYNRDKMAY